MTKKATIKDVARRAGVSHATVSLVFGGDERISPKTCEKVRQAADQLQYVPNLGASNLRRGHSKLIGIIVNDISNPFYGMMVQIAEAAALERGYHLLIADTQWDPERELAAVEKMISFQARGILLCSTERSERTFERLADSRSPSVVALDTCPSHYTGCFIGNDVVNAGRMAAQHLLDSGCRHPVFLNATKPLDSFSSFVSLRNGFVAVLKENGFSKPSQHVIYSGLTIEAGYAAYHRISISHTKVDGIFCANDMCALGVMSAADELGVVAGRDLALVGIDDIPLSKVPRISLTSIRQPHEQVARTAVDILIDSFENDVRPEGSQKFQPELVIRGTSRPLGSSYKAALK
jgi:LacI family transcriptional regulator